MKKLYLSADNLTWIDSSTFGIYLNSDTYLNAPAFDYNEYSVPARNGNLIAYNHRYGNVIRRFDCYINTNIETNYDAFKKWIYTHPGYVYIKSDYDTATYQKGYLAQEIEVAPFNKDGNYSIQFSLYFSCQPQKYSTTSTLTNVNAYWNSYQPMDRNHPQMKSLLSMIPANVIPDDMLFYRISLGYLTSAKTNISASWSGGSCFFACFKADENATSVHTVYGYGLNALDTISSVAVDNTKVLYIVFGARQSGTITYKYNNQTDTITGLDYGIATFNGWQGVSLPPISITMEGGTSVTKAYSYLIFKRYLDNELVGEGMVTIHMVGSVNTYDYIYVEDDTVKWLCELDVDNMTFNVVKTGMANLKVNEWANITGDITGMCDKLTLQIVISSGYGTVESAGITPLWWKV